MNGQHNRGFGVFDPVGHVVISFPTARHAGEAVRALSAIGLGGDAVRQYSDREMIEQIDSDFERVGVAASEQAHDQVKAQRELALMGYHWLVVHAPDGELAVRVAEVAGLHGAARARSHRPSA